MAGERRDSVNGINFENTEPPYPMHTEYKSKYDIKYDYVLSFITNASQEDINAMYAKTMDIATTLENAKHSAKNLAKQIIHKTSVVNGLENDSFKGSAKDFYDSLSRFVSSDRSGLEARKEMIDIIKRYKDFKKTYGKESMFITVWHRIFPSEFISMELEGGMRGGGGTAVKTSEGQTFVVDSMRKNWTVSKKYKKWVKKLTYKQKPNKKSEDLCIGKGSICKGDLGIPRKYMPQFTTEDDVKRFTRFIKRLYNINSFRTTRRVKDLKPSQGEISRPRIKRMIRNEDVLKKVTVPLVVSGDNYIVDGHHRWAAYRLEKPENKLPVMVIDAPIKDVLGIAVAWGAKHQEF